MTLNGYDQWKMHDAAGDAAASRDRGCNDQRDEAIQNLTAAFDANAGYAQDEYLNPGSLVKLIAEARVSKDYADLGERLSMLSIAGCAEFIRANVDDECERLLDDEIERDEMMAAEYKADAFEARCDSEAGR